MLHLVPYRTGSTVVPRMHQITSFPAAILKANKMAASFKRAAQNNGKLSCIVPGGNYYCYCIKKEISLT